MNVNKTTRVPLVFKCLITLVFFCKLIHGQRFSRDKSNIMSLLYRLAKIYMSCIICGVLNVKILISLVKNIHRVVKFSSYSELIRFPLPNPTWKFFWIETRRLRIILKKLNLIKRFPFTVNVTNSALTKALIVNFFSVCLLLYMKSREESVI